MEYYWRDAGRERNDIDYHPTNQRSSTGRRQRVGAWNVAMSSTTASIVAMEGSKNSLFIDPHDDAFACYWMTCSFCETCAEVIRSVLSAVVFSKTNDVSSVSSCPCACAAFYVPHGSTSCHCCYHYCCWKPRTVLVVDAFSSRSLSLARK